MRTGWPFVPQLAAREDALGPYHEVGHRPSPTPGNETCVPAPAPHDPTLVSL